MCVCGCVGVCGVWVCVGVCGCGVCVGVIECAYAASGEPPLCMSCSLLFAVKRAIESARQDAGNNDVFPLGDCLLVCYAVYECVFHAVGPATVDAIQTACLVNSSQFTL